MISKRFDWFDCLLIVLMITTLALGFAGQQKTKTVSVPVVVHSGDTLDGIVLKLADKYGDERDYRVIRHYAIKDNKISQCLIYPGDLLNIRLEVPVND